MRSPVRPTLCRLERLLPAASPLSSPRPGEEIVLVCCWSSKGGAGTTVVACALAVVLGRSSPGSLLVDLAGDVPAALGIGDDAGRPGVAEWLDSGDGVPADALARVEIAVRDGLALLPRGQGALRAARAHAFAAVLGADPRAVVVDAGCAGGLAEGDALVELTATLAAAADRSLLVVRPCFLALRRAVQAPVRPTGVVFVAEAGRALTAADVEEVLGVPVRASVSVTAPVARAVDAGLLAARLPRSLEREVRDAA